MYLYIFTHIYLDPYTKRNQSIAEAGTDAAGRYIYICIALCVSLSLYIYIYI